MAIKIMVVDDDLTTLALLKATLERLEAQVLAMGDSREAAERVHTERFDFILLDAHMPHIDGFELTRRIRVSRLNSAVPVVMLTATDDGETMREGFRSGITFFLGKPVKLAKLRGLLGAAHGAILKERRRHVRIPFRTAVNCRFGEQHFTAESVNLGGSGMAFRPSGGLAEGQILEARFALPGDNRQLKLDAKVLRNEPPDGVAVEFVDLPLEERAALKNYFASFLQGSR
jgi:CheY-like chemotaxis protein